jgi:hypothetical protein
MTSLMTRLCCRLHISRRYGIGTSIVGIGGGGGGGSGGHGGNGGVLDATRRYPWSIASRDGPAAVGTVRRQLERAGVAHDTLIQVGVCARVATPPHTVAVTLLSSVLHVQQCRSRPRAHGSHR